VYPQHNNNKKSNCIIVKVLWGLNFLWSLKSVEIMTVGLVEWYYVLNPLCTNDFNSSSERMSLKFLKFVLAGCECEFYTRGALAWGWSGRSFFWWPMVVLHFVSCAPAIFHS
jgi:hypothetical protein